MKTQIVKKDIDVSLLETVSVCPFCHSSAYHQIGFEFGFPYVRCSECSLIWLKERLKEENIGLIYDNNYQGVKNLPYELRIAKKRLDLFSFAKGSFRIHEDGAGIGSFVSVAKKEGHDVTASDMGFDAVRMAKKTFNIDVFHSALSDLSFKSNSLDGFACFNLLSHLYEPWAYISEVSRILKKGGKFLIRTGNRTGIFESYGRFSAPEHVFHFNKKNLAHMLDVNGFLLVRCVPAFDSDFPLEWLRLKFHVHESSFLGIIHLLWTILRLPKDDYFYLAVKK